MNLTDLPSDQLTDIFMQSDLKALKKLCTLNVQFRDLCQDENLWRQKFMADFGLRMIVPKSWKNAYRLQVKPQLEFETTITKIFDWNTQVEEQVSLKGIIDLARFEPYTDHDENNYGNDGLTVFGYLKVRVETDRAMGREIRNRDFDQAVKNVLAPYFNYFDQIDGDIWYINNSHGPDLYQTSVGSQLTIEILDICRMS